MNLLEKMHAVMDAVNSEVAEREEVVELIAIALLTRKNVFFLGDVGQAKSLVINLFRDRVTSARQFSHLMSKQCTEEQLFGQLDLSTLIPGNPDKDVLDKDEVYQGWLKDLEDATRALREQPEDGPALSALERQAQRLEAYRKALYLIHGNKPKLQTDGKIPTSYVVFLDEIWKANDGIVNSLLTALNERKFTNEGQTMDLPTISFFAASNEIPTFTNPEEAILRAVYDRFELKAVTEYVKDRGNRLRILKNKQQGAALPSADASFTLDELFEMQKEVAAVTVPDSINELMDDILCELRDRGLHISDRKYFGYYPLAQAKAWLDGRDKVESRDLLILSAYLWTTPEDRAVICPYLEHKCIDPLKQQLEDVHKMALESFAQFEAATDANPIVRVGKLRDELLQLYELLLDTQARAADDNERGRIDAEVDELEALNERAHQETQRPYASLQAIREIKHSASA